MEVGCPDGIFHPNGVAKFLSNGAAIVFLEFAGFGSSQSSWIFPPKFVLRCSLPQCCAHPLICMVDTVHLVNRAVWTVRLESLQSRLGTGISITDVPCVAKSVLSTSYQGRHF